MLFTALCSVYLAVMIHVVSAGMSISPEELFLSSQAHLDGHTILPNSNPSPPKYSPQHVQAPPWFPKPRKQGLHDSSPHPTKSSKMHDMKGGDHKVARELEGGGGGERNSFHFGQNNDHNRKLNAFYNVNSACANNDVSIERGHSGVINNLTDPSVYDMRMRPNLAPVISGPFKGRPISVQPDNITFSIAISSIDKINMKDQEIAMSVFEITRWHDPRLAYDLNDEARCVFGSGRFFSPSIHIFESEYDGDYQKIWRPRLFMLNQRGASVETKAYSLVDQYGYVTHFVQKSIVFSCPMTFGTFPYSEVECFLAYTSFDQTSDEVLLVQTIIPGLTFTTELIDLSSYTFFFQIAGFDLVQKTETTVRLAIPVGRQFVYGSLKFKRQSGSMWEEVYVPDFLLHLAIFASFWVSRLAAPARVTLPIISLLTFRVVMSSLDDTLPDVQYDLWIVDFLLASQMFAVAALVQFALVQYFIHSEEAKQYVLKSLSNSSVLTLLDTDKFTAADLFEYAIERHGKFHAAMHKVNHMTLLTRWKQLVHEWSMRCGIAHWSHNDKQESNITRQDRQVGGSLDNGFNHTASNMKVTNTKVLPFNDDAKEKNTSNNLEMTNIEEGSLETTNAGTNNMREVGAIQAETSFDNKQQTSTSPQHNPRKSSLFRLSKGSSFSQLLLLKKRAQSDNFEDLDISEVLNLTIVYEVFNKFDYSHKGYLTAKEFRGSLRYFGYFYSNLQVCAVMEAFWHEYGTTLADHPHLDLETFLRLLIRHETHKPIRDLHRSVWCERPSLICDVMARIIYPLLYLGRIWLFISIMDEYSQPADFYL